jgi:small subunit ribosomal protein S25e
MPPKVQQKTKEQKMAAAMAGSKGKKKKWSKGKSRDKVENKVLFNKEAYEKLYAEVPKMKLITVAAMVERLKINAGLARKAIIELTEAGLIKPIVNTSSMKIYTRTTSDE